MLNFNSGLIFSQNPQKLAGFYQQVFDKKPDWNGGDFMGFKIGSGWLTIGPHSQVMGKNQNPQRLMFNLETTEVKDEFERIKKLGAKVIAEPYQPKEAPEEWIATFADPDDNYFQVMTPMG